MRYLTWGSFFDLDFLLFVNVRVGNGAIFSQDKPTIILFLDTGFVYLLTLKYVSE
jgi:hypothetical protein